MGWTKTFIYVVLFIAIYYPALQRLVFTDWTREGYSYAYLVPFVVLYLFWEKREEWTAIPPSASWKGLIPLLLGICLFWIGELAGEFYTVYISLWLVLVGLFWIHHGWQRLKRVWFAFFFILTMFPVPQFIHTKLTLNLRLISSRLGVNIIQASGLPAYREGNIIDMSFAKFQVVEACSGLHSLISLFVLGLLLVYFFNTHIWKRIFLLLSTVPISILANSMRIAMTAFIFKYWGPEMAQGFFHLFSGFLIFIVCIPVLLIEMWLLSKLPPVETRANSTVNEKKPVSHKNSVDKDVGSNSSGKWFQGVFVAGVVLLGATLGFSTGIDFREKTPMNRSFDLFPLKINEWTGMRKTMDQRIIDALDFSDYIIVDYQNKNGGNVELYVAYYESQTKGASIHSPATCLSGSGWEFNEAGSAVIKAADNDSMEVNRAFIQKGTYEQLCYYWFPGRGRVLANAYELKLFAFWDALTRQRTDGALVRLITPVYEIEDLEDAEKRLQEFVKDIVPVLEEFIPG